jgi:hypothetical protein
MGTEGSLPHSQESATYPYLRKATRCQNLDN